MGRHSEKMVRADGAQPQEGLNFVPAIVCDAGRRCMSAGGAGVQLRCRWQCGAARRLQGEKICLLGMAPGLTLHWTVAGARTAGKAQGEAEIVRRQGKRRMLTRADGALSKRASALRRLGERGGGGGR